MVTSLFPELLHNERWIFCGGFVALRTCVYLIERDSRAKSPSSVSKRVCRARAYRRDRSLAPVSNQRGTSDSGTKHTIIPPRAEQTTALYAKLAQE